MLKRAFSKLKLKHVVIGKRDFKQEKTKVNSIDIMDVNDGSKEDILSLLRDEEDAEDKRVQTDISEEDLEKVLDRCDLVHGGPISTLPLKGPGWEVIIPTATGGVLSTLNS